MIVCILLSHCHTVTHAHTHTHTHTQITCQVKQEFNGSSCGLKYGLITCLCMPRCGEQPIRVQTGDIVVITRWGKRWVYGDRKLPQGE